MAIYFINEVGQEISDRDSLAEILSNLGWTYNILEQYQEATEALYTAIILFESLRDRDLSDEEKIAFFDLQNRPYRDLQHSLAAQGELEQALEIAERGRARAFVSLLAEKLRIRFFDAPSLAKIQQLARQENATLVQYSVIGSDRLFVWIIQPTGTIDFREIDLGSLDGSLDDFIASIRENIGIRSRDLDGDIVARLTEEEQQRQTAQQRQSLQKLHQLLIEPIAELLPADPEDPIVFIPHDSLFLVPFPALINADGEYLIQNHTILTAPSIQVLDLTRQNRRPPKPNPNPEDFLIVGNPTMPRVENRETGEIQTLKYLEGAEDEAVTIAELFNTQPLLWDNATETAVTERMTTAEIIHLATHGLLDYGRETGPLDFPGAIALAPGHGEDGLLTSAELLDMELQAQLVVLSACDTGRGRLSSDGVIGLSRALIGAGVPNVMVSLWSVPDAPTADLMTEFYQQWQTTGNKAQALRSAMLTMMETHPDPFNWAAFTLIGEAHTGQNLDLSAAEVTNSELSSGVVEEMKPEVEVDYTQLEQYLEAGDWEEANRETAKLMFELDDLYNGTAHNQDNRLWAEELDRFPCEDLQKIDRLWVTHSDGRFGFSVQADFSRDGRVRTLGGLQTLLRRIGWRNPSVIYYEDVTFDLTAPEGHLPVWRDISAYGVVGCAPSYSAKNRCLVIDANAFFSRFMTCQRLAEETTPKVEVDYTQLQQYLEAGDWKEADWETAKLMVEVVNGDNNIWNIWLSPDRRGALSTQDLLNFPCEELQQIDRLWVTHSDGRFGFSIQSELYHELGGTERFQGGVVKDFLTRIGWYMNPGILYYEDVTFDLTAPEGHLPVWWNQKPGYGVINCGLSPLRPNKCLVVDAGALLTRAKTCGL